MTTCGVVHLRRRGGDEEGTALLSEEATMQEVTVDMEWDGCVDGLNNRDVGWQLVN